MVDADTKQAERTVNLVVMALHHIVQDYFGIQTLGMASHSLNNLASKELMPLSGYLIHFFIDEYIFGNGQDTLHHSELS